ncbi:DUF4931 domain-containing protein, partial [Candidatus Woesearchaeota archaeon]|nr:DUF4931 domain-containing protein [Candidatus Woesearchaeota archaeon]
DSHDNNNQNKNDIKRNNNNESHDKIDYNKEPSEEKSISNECFFCRGHEKETPEEIYRLTKKNNWQIRVFPNKFAVVGSGNANIKTDNDFFTFADGVGEHEIIVETPSHNKQLADLPVEELVDVFNTYIFRIKELEKKPDVKYVLVFKNHGPNAGTSIVHSHSQVIAYNLVPTIIKQKEDAVRTYVNKKEEAVRKCADNNQCSSDSCPYCRIIAIEKTSFRKMFENKTFVCFTPYASRMPYEVWFFPKRHILKAEELNNSEKYDLCEILKKVLVKLKEINASYNFYLHSGTGNERNFHFHIELLPRISTWAGFEFGTETIINTTSPEDAAEFYRGEPYKP